MYIVLLGAPGAGKGTQAALLAKDLKLPHIATGDLFRQAVEKKTALGLEAKGYMEKGALAPDELTIRMVLARLAEPDTGRGAILDGFPRNLAQARALDEALSRQGKAIDRAVNIMVAEDALIKRLAGRWICRTCQAPYHETDSPPRVKGGCDRCGGELYQRPDDKAETVKKRLTVYTQETAPLIEYYRRSGKLVEVQGEGKSSEVARRIAAAVRGGKQ